MSSAKGGANSFSGIIPIGLLSGLNHSRRVVSFGKNMSQVSDPSADAVRAGAANENQCSSEAVAGRLHHHVSCL